MGGVGCCCCVLLLVLLVGVIEALLLLLIVVGVLFWLLSCSNGVVAPGVVVPLGCRELKLEYTRAEFRHMSSTLQQKEVRSQG